jgi:hypothetical protein
VEDVLFIAGTLGFFALGLAYVRFCDRIIGPDPADTATTAATPTAADRDLVEVKR